jgi:hypothetical protein
MIGGIEETSASSEARSAPRSYPTASNGVLRFPLIVASRRNYAGSTRHGRLTSRRLAVEDETASPRDAKSPAQGRGLTSLGQLIGSQARESRDSPRLNAFWRVAPSVRFNVLAMLEARVFFLAAVFKIRTSAVDHGRRFDFLAIQ